MQATISRPPENDIIAAVKQTNASERLAELNSAQTSKSTTPTKQNSTKQTALTTNTVMINSACTNTGNNSQLNIIKYNNITNENNQVDELLNRTIKLDLNLQNNIDQKINQGKPNSSSKSNSLSSVNDVSAATSAANSAANSAMHLTHLFDVNNNNHGKINDHLKVSKNSHLPNSSLDKEASSQINQSRGATFTQSDSVFHRISTDPSVLNSLMLLISSQSNSSCNQTNHGIFFNLCDKTSVHEQHNNEINYSNDLRTISSTSIEKLNIRSACNRKLPGTPTHESLIETQNQYVNDDEEDEENRYDYARVDSVVDSSPKTTSTVEQVDLSASPNSQMNLSKSAPATPCNLTPVAFNHQHLLSGNTNLNPANTLPLDIRKNIINSQNLYPSMSQPSFVSDKQLNRFLSKAESALKAKQYSETINFLNDCIDMHAKTSKSWRNEYLVYYYRAEANFSLENYKDSLRDAMQAQKLNPKCIEAYYRQARSQFLLDQQADSLATFAFGLSQDKYNQALFNRFVETALQSKFRSSIEPKIEFLKKSNLHQHPFIVTAIIGQELLNLKHYQHSIVILESALNIGIENNRLRGSVCSSLSAAWCAKKEFKKALEYLQRDLDVELESSDIAGQCRVYGNFGITYYLMRMYMESLEYHRKQLNLSLKSKPKQAAIALSATGHVHVALNDYRSALISHKLSLDIQKEANENNFNQSRELISIGHILAMLGDYDAATSKYEESLQLLNSLPQNEQNLDEVRIITIMIQFNLAYIELRKGNYQGVQEFYRFIFDCAKELQGELGITYEMRAWAGLGHANRIFKSYSKAKKCFEKQLELARLCKDDYSMSQALANMGLIHQFFKEYERAYKMFEENLKLVKDDMLLSAYANSYMGGISYSINNFDDAIHYYKTSFRLFQNLGCESEAMSINANLAFVFNRSGMMIRSSVHDNLNKRSPVSHLNFPG